MTQHEFSRDCQRQILKAIVQSDILIFKKSELSFARELIEEFIPKRSCCLRIEWHRGKGKRR